MCCARIINILVWISIGIGVLFLSFIIHEGLWVIRDAYIVVSPKGVLIYDARNPKYLRGVWLGIPLGEAVDGVYEFLERCIPVEENEREKMFKVQIVLRDSSPTTLFGYDRGLSGYYHEIFEKIHIDGLPILVHEWTHYYLHQRAVKYGGVSIVTRLRFFFLGSGNHHKEYKDIFQRCDYARAY